MQLYTLIYEKKHKLMIKNRFLLLSYSKDFFERAFSYRWVLLHFQGNTYMFSFSTNLHQGHTTWSSSFMVHFFASSISFSLFFRLFYESVYPVSFIFRACLQLDKEGLHYYLYQLRFQLYLNLFRFCPSIKLICYSWEWPDLG